MAKVFVISDNSLSCNERNIKPILKREQGLNKNSTNNITTNERDGNPKINERSLVICSKENNQSDCDNHKNLKSEKANPSNVAIELNSSGNTILSKENIKQKKRVTFATDSVSVLEIPSNANNESMMQRHGTGYKNSLPNKLEYGISENASSSDFSLEYEKCVFEEFGRKRLERFNSILFNDASPVSWKKLFLYVFGVIIVSFLSTVPLTLVPAHNLVLNPKYWYEILFHVTFSVILGSIVNSFMASHFLNIRQTKKISNIVRMCLIEHLACLSFLIATHYIWTHILTFQYPIPFLGIIVTYSFVMIYCLIIWLHFPESWRLDSEFKKRMKSYALFWHIHLTVCAIYIIIADILRQYPNQYQPIIALSLVITREVLLLFGCKLVKITATGDENGAYIILKYVVCVNHIIILCTVIGSYITRTTIWVLICLDFGMNIFLCLKVVWHKKRNPSMITNQINALQDLAICELVEFMAALSFILVFSVAYFGPNANLFGNISNSYWNYVAIEDIALTLGNMTLFFLVDFSSIIVSALILWYFCNINLMKVLMVFLEEFGIDFGLILSFGLIVVCY